MLPRESGGWLREQQVPPLRFAPVGMTIHILVRDASAQQNFHPDKKSTQAFRQETGLPCKRRLQGWKELGGPGKRIFTPKE